MEAFGAATGAISLAGIVGKTMEIKRLLDEVKDVPCEIQNLLEEVENMGYLFESIEEQMMLEPAGLRPPSAQRSVVNLVLRRSQLALKPLKGATVMLSQELKTAKSSSRRRFTSAKVVLLKKPTLDALEKRLRRSVELLQLAMQLHTTSIMTQTSTVVMQRLSDREVPLARQPLPGPGDENDTRKDDQDDGHSMKTVATTTTSCTTPSSVSTTTTLGTSGSECVAPKPKFQSKAGWFGQCSMSFTSGNGVEITVQTPSWLAGSVYAAAARRSLGEWSFLLRRYDSIRKWDEDIDWAIKTDDVEALDQTLRDTGISRFARDSNNVTLLHLACYHAKPGVLEYLLNIGLGVFVEDDPRHNSSLVKRASCTHWIALIFRQLDIPGTRLDISGWWMPQDEEQLRMIELLLPFTSGGLLNNIDAYRAFLLFGPNPDRSFKVGLTPMARTTEQFHRKGQRLYQENWMPGFSSLPLSERLDMARVAAGAYRVPDPGAFHLMLPEVEKMSAEFSKASRMAKNSTSVVHTLARNMADELRLYMKKPTGRSTYASLSSLATFESRFGGLLARCVERDPASRHWLEVPATASCEEINRAERLRLTSELQSEDDGPWGKGGSVSPLFSYLFGIGPLLLKKMAHTGQTQKQLEPEDPNVLFPWLVTLRRGGVDLREYGRREKEVMGSSNRIWGDLMPRLFGILDGACRLSVSDGLHFKVVGVTYGPRVQDWVLWSVTEYEHFAGQFWNLVEHPPLEIPGSWVDDRDEIQKDVDEWLEDLTDTCWIWSEVAE